MRAMKKVIEMATKRAMTKAMRKDIATLRTSDFNKSASALFFCAQNTKISNFHECGAYRDFVEMWAIFFPALGHMNV